MEILIVEDDVHINNLLAEALSKACYTCVQAFSGSEALLLCERREFSLILLDLMLPGISGEQVLSKLREKCQTPVIVLTAKDGINQKVDVLMGGADDYITKPFDIKEVLARVAVQLRRGHPETEPEILYFKQLQLNKTTYQVLINGVELKITRQEFNILELFLTHPKKVFSKDEVFEYAWKEPFVGETKVIDVHISNIRKKIKEVTEDGYIETVWGIGYRLARE